jgi:hypothetical protein
MYFSRLQSSFPAKVSVGMMYECSQRWLFCCAPLKTILRTVIPPTDRKRSLWQLRVHLESPQWRVSVLCRRRDSENDSAVSCAVLAEFLLPVEEVTTTTAETIIAGDECYIYLSNFSASDGRSSSAVGNCHPSMVAKARPTQLFPSSSVMDKSGPSRSSHATATTSPSFNFCTAF